MKYPCLDGQERDFVPGTKVGVTDTEPPVGTLVDYGSNKAPMLRIAEGLDDSFYCYSCRTGYHIWSPDKFEQAHMRWEADV